MFALRKTAVHLLTSSVRVHRSELRCLGFWTVKMHVVREHCAAASLGHA